jgi:hypothetical protein
MTTTMSTVFLSTARRYLNRPTRVCTPFKFVESYKFALLKKTDNFTYALTFAGKPHPDVSSRLQLDVDEDSDLDGMPLGPSNEKKKSGPAAGFVPSKWETIDPEDVQAQAVTSKWDIFDHDNDAESGKAVAAAKKGIMDPDDDEDDIDGKLYSYNQLMQSKDQSTPFLSELHINILNRTIPLLLRCSLPRRQSA